MGWKGTLRSMEAAARRAERENTRYLKQQQKEYEAAQARQDVENYERYIEVMTSFHKSVVPFIDWITLSKKAAPSLPIKNTSRETQAEFELKTYKPNFFIKFFRLINWRIGKLKTRLEDAINKDEYDFQQELSVYKKELDIFTFNHEMANKIIQGDLEEYAKAILEYKACEQIEGQVNVIFLSPQLAEVNVTVATTDIVPRTSKVLLKSNKVSEKDLPVTKIYTLYQDYVCSTLLRCARDIFSVLPIEEIYISAETDLLDSSTGLIDKKVILSLRVPRRTIEKMNFSQIDPSDALKNFIHNIDFKTGIGFKEIEKVKVA